MIYGLITILAVSAIITLTVAQNPSFILPHISKRPENIDTILIQLVESFERGEDIEAFAETHGLQIQDEKVRIVIELYDGDADLITNCAIRIEARQDKFIQATMPIEEIYELANSPLVKYISIPKKPISTA